MVASLAARARFYLPDLPVGAMGAVDTQGSRRASHEALVALAKVEASMGAGMGVGGAAEPLGSRAGAHGPMRYKLTNTYTVLRVAYSNCDTQQSCPYCVSLHPVAYREFDFPKH